ncbi:aminopeptidase 1 [Pseudoleptotrichia goodfellowii]|uniref:M18 family aminopeptidase n=1 Tax=Pseudoleptotrichia goodfellowii TaxID=157692 RepID=A0A510J9T2_9FUSO|nr:aminopeptidase [Pseudoleptotrichia goodfellowii]BBM35171.1 aminopeptidase 1 [Pseudoleptotrichia goodfellowii]
MTRENLWKSYSEKEKKQIFKFAEEYKSYLNVAKTEREFVAITEKELIENGFTDINKKKTLKKGDKVYYNNRDKNIVAVIIGKDIKSGINMIVSHVDSPRLDLKPNPIKEDEEFALLNTHYYGGIKKYQWAATPLALHGVVYLKDGKKVTLAIGEDENDPVFSVPDLLPHLAHKIQDDRKARETIQGEELKLLFGNMPVNDKNVKQQTKQMIMDKLKKDYGIEEDDFFTAELEIVPAGKLRDVGLDRSMIGGYGQDDRICAYTSLRAIYEVKNPEKTAMVYLTDKEEVGSEGSTSLKATLPELIIGKMLSMTEKNYNDQILRETLWNSKALSSDVTAAMNPVFKAVHDGENVARLSYGLAFAKYTGSRGKVSANDADAEYLQEIRQLFEKNKIKYQAGGFGKVDEGGGGTVAKYLAHYGIKTVDAGPAVLSMHSLFEISSKADLYETYRAYRVFFDLK